MAIIVAATYPGLADGLPDWVLLFTYIWLSASMLAADLLRRLEPVRGLGRLARPLPYVVGEHAEMAWEKTGKTGAVGDLA